MSVCVSFPAPRGQIELNNRPNGLRVRSNQPNPITQPSTPVLPPLSLVFHRYGNGIKDFTSSAAVMGRTDDAPVHPNRTDLSRTEPLTSQQNNSGNNIVT